MKKAVYQMLMIAGCLFWLSGCETTRLPDPYDFEVALGRDLRGASVQVDLIGIPAEELDRFVNYSVTSYFEPGDSLRAGAVKETLSFRRDAPEVQLLSARSPIWTDWIENRGAAYVVILADTPGLKEDEPGNADSRRLIIPLHQAKWDRRPDRVRITVTGDDVTADPMPLETY